jgi:hypothetical protein
LRIMVVYDKQANALTPATNSILTTDQFQSANNISNRDRFVTIMDWITPPISTQGPFTQYDMKYQKLRLDTQYNTGSVGDVTDISTGSIHIMAAQTNTINTAAPLCTAQCRIRYTDT